MHFPAPAFHSIFKGLKLRDILLGIALFSFVFIAVQTIDWQKTESFHASALQDQEIQSLQKRVEFLESQLEKFSKTNSTAPF